jgi:hypothetical protein
MRKATLCVAGAVVALCCTVARPASAQNFILNSAETIDKGTFKLGAYPVILFGEDDAEDAWGVAVRAGYGFSNSFDVELKGAFLEDFNMLGLDAEYWFVKGKVDVSVVAGFHFTDSDLGVDSKAFDIAAIGSGRIAENLDLYGALNVSAESLDDVPDSDFTRVYLSPGLEYRLSPNVDLLAEIGVGLNDDSPNYIAFGVAFYIR